mgnify:CR=1 FL=1
MTAIKVAEALQAIRDGGRELDMVVNIGKVAGTKAATLGVALLGLASVLRSLPSGVAVEELSTNEGTGYSKVQTEVPKAVPQRSSLSASRRSMREVHDQVSC